MAKLADLWIKLGLKSGDFNRGLDSAKQKTSAFSSGIKKIGGMIAGVFAVGQITRFTSELVKLGGVAEGVRDAFNRIADDKILRDLQSATAGTVSELELMKRAVSANNLGLPVENLASLFQFATKRAQETGESVDYLVNSIVTGIGRKSPLILDNLGISAIQLRKKLKGVGMESASVVDVAAAVGEIAAESMGRSGGIIEDNNIKVQQLRASWEDLKLSIAESEGIQSGGSAVLNTMKWYVDNMPKVIADWREFARISSAVMTGGLSLLWSKKKKVEEQTQAISKSRAEIDAESEAYIKNLAAQGEAIRNKEKYGETVGDLKTKIEELKSSIDDYGVNQEAEIQKTLREIEAAEKLIETLTKLKQVRSPEYKPPTMTGSKGTPTMSDGIMPDSGGLADMTGFLKKNAEMTKKYTDEMMADWNNFSQNLGFLIEDEIVNSIDEFARSLGQLASGSINMKGFFNNILSQLGKFLGQIGKLMMAFGVAQLAFGTSLKNIFNPASAPVLIAAGAALVAISGAIGGMASKAAATGGATGSAGGFSVSSRAFMPFDGRDKSKVEVSGVLMGDNILLSNNRANYRRGVIG